MTKRLNNAFHNYRYELESLENKYAWFAKEQRSVYDLFIDRDLLKDLSPELELPVYLREQIATIRAWYNEMNAQGDAQTPG